MLNLKVINLRDFKFNKVKLIITFYKNKSFAQRLLFKVNDVFNFINYF